MNKSLLRFHRTQRGFTLIELIVSLAVFALFILMIDAVFSSARTNSRKTEIAADVQQNARVAVDRLTRELREARARTDPFLCPVLVDCMLVDTSQGAGRHGILFKSARLVGTPTVFCLYVRSSTETFYNAACFDSFSGTDVPKPAPTYSGPPYPLCAPNIDSNKLAPCGTYAPIWQQYVGYYVEVLADGSRQLRRVSGQLNSAGQALTASLLTGGDVVATMTESFDVDVSAAGVVSVALKAKGTETVQGRAIPDQEIQLPGMSLSRD